MHIKNLLNTKKTLISFEFFPPKTSQQSHELFDTIASLKNLSPAFISITCGAAGSEQNLTHDLVLKIQKETKLNLVAHLVCSNASLEQIEKTLNLYSNAKIKNIFALRGDKRKDLENTSHFKYASELVKYIKLNFPEFGIGVAGHPEGHPESLDQKAEIEFLKQKVDLGADYICTQLFFDNNVFYEFQEKCIKARINVPIIAGLMPIQTLKGLERILSLTPSTKVPQAFLNGFSNEKTLEKQRDFGHQWTLNQANDLIKNGCQGIHFYTLNKSNATLNICKKLNL